MSNLNNEETKICPRCGNEVLERRAQCAKCHYCFPMSCEGCGREVMGRIFCRECSESGEYHFQRTESLRLTRPEEKSAEKLVEQMLNDPRNE